MAAAFAVASVVAACGNVSNSASGDHSPLADAIGWDPMFQIWPVNELNRMEADCLRARGFDVPGLPPRDVTSDTSMGLSGLLASPDGDPEESFIYGPFEANLSGAVQEQFYEALWECNAQSLDAVYGTIGGERSPIVQAALDEMYARVNADQRVVDAKATYAACVKARGISGITSPEDLYDRRNDMYPELVDLMNANPGITESDPAVAAMLKTEALLATADADCKTESEFDATGEEVAREVQVEYLEQNPGFPEAVAKLKTPVPDGCSDRARIEAS